MGAVLWFVALIVLVVVIVVIARIIEMADTLRRIEKLLAAQQTKE